VCSILPHLKGERKKKEEKQSKKNSRKWKEKRKRKKRNVDIWEISHKVDRNIPIHKLWSTPLNPIYN
jgi:hypothetical protein